MYTIKLTTTSPSWPLARQTPGARGVWGDCRFLINNHVEACDFWVVLDDLLQSETALCPSGNTILVTGEPPDVKRYPRGFVRQFGTVVTCQRNIRHPRVIYSQQGLPWHVGRRQLNHQNIAFSKDYDELTAMISFPKSRTLSVIISNKTMTRGHRDRVEFVKALSALLGPRLEAFGRGINEIEDKWDAIAPYRYHITLENASLPDYWTEKLSDCFLGGAFPFYYGCSNISDYFPTGSFIPIPLDADAATSIIRRAIEDGVYEQAQAQLALARDMVLNEYNMFPMLCRLISGMDHARPAVPTTIYPTGHFPPSALAITLTKIRGLPVRLKKAVR